VPLGILLLTKIAVIGKTFKNHGSNVWSTYGHIKSARVERFSKSKHGLALGCNTITTNSPKPTKSCTIHKDLLKHLNKTAFLLVAEILTNFSGY